MQNSGQHVTGLLQCVVFDVCLLLSAVFGGSRMDVQCPLHRGGGDLVPCVEQTQRVSDQIQYQGPVFRHVCGVPAAHCSLSLVRVC